MTTPVIQKRPWWTALLVVNYLSGAHLALVFALRPLAPEILPGPILVLVVFGGVPGTGAAILVGWLVLALSKRSPGRRPSVDALVAAGVGALVAPFLLIAGGVLVLWGTR
ncbi:hypothetical protein [Cryptosporangium aurantiacum]|uniref:Uncharacterized protein n=1 Tax=Cryptosporangium aurantiacum TaxID=134849 RepID=A0A1M7RDR1_9ACTN|nr:hypothetical protein [Cryptosporangium aurantiacum]SHN44302.1 hypothetical protein SAMN05443668_110155 [Cryptosporangium aurantiacum]